MITDRINNLIEYKSRLLNGDISPFTQPVIESINKVALEYILQRDNLTEFNIKEIRLILEISNIIYNNTNRDLMIIDDGVYDLLIELYRMYDTSIPIGSVAVNFPEFNIISTRSNTIIDAFDVMDRDDLLYKDDLKPGYGLPVYLKDAFNVEQDFAISQNKVSKRVIGKKQSSPELLGTLDKCKFVLINQAMEKGVIDDPKVKVFERDFLNKFINLGILDASDIELVVSLKYDGVSVLTDGPVIITSAVSRGDVSEGEGADLTPIFGGRAFPRGVLEFPDDYDFDIKHEAIMTYRNLDLFNETRDVPYKNPRTAVIGILGSSDVMKYKDYITLVPLATSLSGISKIEEAFLMNEYLIFEESYRHAFISGDYMSVLFQVKRFFDEAEYMRPFMPFMYDGIVVTINDYDIRKKLGRVNGIDQSSIAIKFTPLKRLTTFRGYTYSVGQDGVITPKIHYDPVEFYGTIHPKSSGHSYGRFKELGLRLGDIIEVEYTSDVMPYVSKPDNSQNASNTNPLVEFPKFCPECGITLIESASGKNMKCTNLNCKGIKMARVVGMASKLGLTDFAEENLAKMNATSFKDLFSYTRDSLEELGFGPLMTEKFLNQIQELNSKPIKDYKIIGSLGFDNVARATWMKVLRFISVEEIISLPDDELLSRLVSIKGIGKSKGLVIVDSREYFMDDLLYISNMPNVERTLGIVPKSVRFTGIRSAELTSILEELGYDVDPNGSVSSTTDILIVPSYSYSSTKTDTVKNGGGIIVSLNDMMLDPHKYL